MSPRIKRVLLAAAAAALAAATAGSAAAQQTTTSQQTTSTLQTDTPTTLPASSQPQQSGAAQSPPTTVAPSRATPQNYTRREKATFGAQAGKPKLLTGGVQMTKEDTAPARGYTAPTSMAADPEDPRVIVGAVANLRARTCHLVRSTDAGRTWTFSKTPPAPPGYPFCTSTMSGVPEASLAWGRNHTIYYGLMAYDIISGQEGPNDGRTSIALARSTDLGDTWKFTMVEDNRPRPPEQGNAILRATGVTGLAVDTSTPRDTVYVAYNQSYINAPAGSALVNPRPVIATSTDAGQTFAPAVNLNDSSANLSRTIDGKQYTLLMRTGFGAPYVTAHNGVVLAVAGADFRPGEAPVPAPGAGQGLTAGTFAAIAQPQVVARSTDQGKTWEVKELGPPIYTGNGSMTGLGWTREGGGTFVAIYAGAHEQSATNGVSDVNMQRSTDNGVTWTPPVAISDDRPDEWTLNFYPQLQVAPNGRIDAVWQDNRDLADFHFNVRYTYSTDGGKTWAPSVVVNDRPLDFNFGISFNSDIRFPPGVASTDQYAAIGWADSRFADQESQTQDAFGSTAQFKALPTTKNTTLPIVAAAFAGLVAAGVILLVIMTARRRSAPDTSKAKARGGESVRTT
jgi:hypothetical protein